MISMDSKMKIVYYVQLEKTNKFIIDKGNEYPSNHHSNIIENSTPIASRVIQIQIIKAVFSR